MLMAGVEMRRTSLSVCLAVLLDEMVGQQQDVVLALAQRRQVDREDVEPVVQVLAERAVLDQPAPGRGWWRR